MKKLVLSLLAIAGLHSINSLAMQSSALQQATLAGIPDDVKVLIVTATASAKNIDEATQALRALSETNKKFNAIVNDPKLSNELISMLGEKYIYNTIPEEWGWIIDRHKVAQAYAAYKLHTKQSKQWLNDFLTKPENKLIGEAALILAVSETNKPEDLINYLIANGVNPNIPDVRSLIPILHPLVTAIVFANKPAIEALLKTKKIDLSNLDNGQTFLHIAVGTKRPDFVKMLLDAGANPNLADVNGETVLDYAKRLGFSYIAEILENKLKG